MQRPRRECRSIQALSSMNSKTAQDRHSNIKQNSIAHVVILNKKQTGSLIHQLNTASIQHLHDATQAKKQASKAMQCNATSPRVILPPAPQGQTERKPI
ncbi:hypothetical protein BDW62DRAFT_120548 [Aspergillus aurantiobrunneus]